MYVSKKTHKLSKLGHTDLDFGLCSSVGLCLQDYTSLYV